MSLSINITFVNNTHYVD